MDRNLTRQFSLYNDAYPMKIFTGRPPLKRQSTTYSTRGKLSRESSKDSGERIRVYTKLKRQSSVKSTDARRLLGRLSRQGSSKQGVDRRKILKNYKYNPLSTETNADTDNQTDQVTDISVL